MTEIEIDECNKIDEERNKIVDHYLGFLNEIKDTCNFETLSSAHELVMNNFMNTSEDAWVTTPEKYKK